MQLNCEEKFLTLLRQLIKNELEVHAMENARLEFDRELMAHQAELIKDLRNVGVRISTVWDL